MAQKLNLVKARIISSTEELMAFKKEATASLLRFAESNDCDLEAIARDLTTKYAEIAAALTDGYQVESQVDIYPQPAPPVKTACMQPLRAAAPGDPLHHPTPAQQDEGNPEAQDPADLVESQQERELSESTITMEDIAKLLAESPAKQRLAARVVAAASALGNKAALHLVAGIAKDRYSAKELQQITASLRVIAADEADDNAEEEQDDAVATHAPKEKDQLDIEEYFSEGKFKALSDMVSQFNDLMDAVDPEMQLLPPVSVDEVVRKMDVDESRERQVVPEAPMEPVPAVYPSKSELDPEHFEKAKSRAAEEEAEREQFPPSAKVLPAFNQLSPQDKALAMEGFEAGDEAKAVDQWYAENNANVISDMALGVEQYLASRGITGFTGEQIVDKFIAERKGEGHITYQDIPRLVGEFRRQDPDYTAPSGPVVDDGADMAEPAQWGEAPVYDPVGHKLTKDRTVYYDDSTGGVSTRTEPVEYTTVPVPYSVIGPFEGAGFPYAILNELTGDVEFQASTMEKAQEKMDQLADATVMVPSSIADDPQKVEKYLRRQVGKDHYPEEADRIHRRLPVEKAYKRAGW